MGIGRTGRTGRSVQARRVRTQLVFVTGRGGAGFHSPDPALTRGRGGYVSGNQRSAPFRGPPALIPWTGPRLLPPIFNGDLAGGWVGRGPERGQGQGMPKKTPRPRPLSGAGRGKGPGARVFLGPVRPVTNSRRNTPVSDAGHLFADGDRQLAQGLSIAHYQLS